MSMQWKGEGFIMTGKEYCRYIRTYSQLEGLQRAHTLIYSARTVPGGVVVQLRQEQDGRVECSTVITPPGSFARVMQLLRYLWENSVGLQQWLEVLTDAGQPYCRAENSCGSEQNAAVQDESRCFCGIC